MNDAGSPYRPARMQPGHDAPMGATARDGGVNFAVFSEHAQAVELCLFDAEGRQELRRLRLHGPHAGVWSGFLPGAGPGLVYGLRAHGPWAPQHGHRFNPHKLLLDPWAREIVGRFAWDDAHFDHVRDAYAPLQPDLRDNAAIALKARVAQPAVVAVAADRPAALLHESRDIVLYEVHVRGYSMQMPGVPQALRGSYLGLSHPASVAHLRALGVTTLSLLPVHYHLNEEGLAARGAVNYWGYNTLGFFCADPRLASAPVREGGDPAAVHAEFRTMVEQLHEAGFEVVLDVVFNHTAEAGETGPTLSFRGLDHASWYRLLPDDPSRCDNLSGCGNTLNVAHPRVTQFVLDALRHWVQVMGVDGFRFDLAPVLGRGRDGYDPRAAFFTALQQDPVLAHTRLIAEPWDAGHAGYQLGRFPGRWLEWNDKFRDAARRYWLDRSVGRGEFARRFTASSDLFHHGQRSPQASVNFITAHDGFTLADLTSYRAKHNQANGEDNRDGRNDEICADFGVEGPTADPEVVQARARARRALLATLLLAQGTPMLCAGDEIGRTQGGNNNAYCQDNPTGWIDWAATDTALRDLVAAVLDLRRREPALRHDRWFHPPPGQPGERTLAWFRADGAPMGVDDWHDTAVHTLACCIDAHPVHPGGIDERHLWIGFNPLPQPAPFVLPAGDWTLLLDASGELDAATFAAAEALSWLPPCTLVVLARRTARADADDACVSASGPDAVAQARTDPPAGGPAGAPATPHVLLAPDTAATAAPAAAPAAGAEVFQQAPVAPASSADGLAAPVTANPSTTR